MPASHVLSVLASHASNIADRALNTPEGLALQYTVDSTGSLPAAKVAAKRFQSAFNVMRNRDRRRLQRRNGENPHTLDAATYSPYDKLACMITPLPADTGYEVRLCREDMLTIGVSIIDISTGLELPDYSSKSAMSDAIAGLLFAESEAAFRERRPKRNPLTTDHVAWVLKHEPETIEFFIERTGIDMRIAAQPTGTF